MSSVQSPLHWWTVSLTNPPWCLVYLQPFPPYLFLLGKSKTFSISRVGHIISRDSSRNCDRIQFCCLTPGSMPVGHFSLSGLATQPTAHRQNSLFPTQRRTAWPSQCPQSGRVGGAAWPICEALVRPAPLLFDINRTPSSPLSLLWRSD